VNKHEGIKLRHKNGSHVSLHLQALQSAHRV
jgi:hypothetical protein